MTKINKMKYTIEDFKKGKVAVAIKYPADQAAKFLALLGFGNPSPYEMPPFDYYYMSPDGDSVWTDTAPDLPVISNQNIEEILELEESKRYWLVVFNSRSTASEGFSNTGVETDKNSPLNRNKLCEIVVNASNGVFTREDVVITNIVEFKNKEDYQNFFA